MPKLFSINEFRMHGISMAVLVIFALTACSERSKTANAVTFPDDTEIASALQADFERNADSAKARELVRLLGGAKEQLEYTIHDVIYRQGAFEVHYDVGMHMSQPGSESLRGLFTSMVPPEALQKLTDKSLAGYEKWLDAQTQALEVRNPQQAAAQRASLQSLNRCYRDAKADDHVPLMSGLTALLSPERGGWYAEKLPSPALQVRCLPL